METDKTVVLTIKQSGKLSNIVFQDTTTHNQVFYKVEKMSMDEIKDLLETKAQIKA